MYPFYSTKCLGAISNFLKCCEANNDTESTVYRLFPFECPLFSSCIDLNANHFAQYNKQHTKALIWSTIAFSVLL